MFAQVSLSLQQKRASLGQTALGTFTLVSMLCFSRVDLGFCTSMMQSPVNGWLSGRSFASAMQQCWCQGLEYLIASL